MITLICIWDGNKWKMKLNERPQSGWKRGKFDRNIAQNPEHVRKRTRKFWFDCIIKLFPEHFGCHYRCWSFNVGFQSNDFENLLPVKQNWAHHCLLYELFQMGEFCSFFCSCSCRHHLITIYSLVFLISIFILLTNQP